jgi:tRNA threonylcarbamoyladenosine biosynthesis protein TsaB
LRIPTYGVSSLDVLALAAEPSGLPVRAVVEAGRGRYATALYGAATEPPRLANLAQLREAIQGETVIIGELTPEDRRVLHQDAHVRLAPVAASVRRGGFLAELGWRMAQRGAAGDPISLDAIYIT